MKCYGIKNHGIKMPPKFATKNASTRNFSSSYHSFGEKQSKKPKICGFSPKDTFYVKKSWIQHSLFYSIPEYRLKKLTTTTRVLLNLRKESSSATGFSCN